MNDPPLAKGEIGGFSKLLNPPLPPFSKGGDANKYMLRVICPHAYHSIIPLFHYSIFVS